MSPRARPRQQGQTLVVLALAMTALLLATAVVIDGGNAFAQQRRSQNGTDAAAEAGAVQLARMFSGVGITDADVDLAIDASAAATGLTRVELAEYTDKAGAALGLVGDGTIPSGTQGVRVVADLDFDTYLAGLAGQPAWTATTQATAITGYAEETGFGAVMPLTFPVLLTWCQSGGGSTKFIFPDDGIANPNPPNPEDWNPTPGTPWPFGPANLVAIPLCSNGPGNVGWIDWDPPNGGVPDVAADITGGTSIPITTPKWYYATETGANTALDPAMDIWEGKDIQLPIFHTEADITGTPFDEQLIGTCDAIPNDDQRDLTDCPTADIGANGQGWYFLETIAVFHLQNSYIQGNHQSECNHPSLVSPASEPGSGSQAVNNCLIGYFKEKVVAKNVTVGGTTPVNQFTPLAIQLID